MAAEAHQKQTLGYGALPSQAAGQARVGRVELHVERVASGSEYSAREGVHASHGQLEALGRGLHPDRLLIDEVLTPAEVELIRPAAQALDTVGTLPIFTLLLGLVLVLDPTSRRGFFSGDISCLSSRQTRLGPRDMLKWHHRPTGAQHPRGGTYIR